MEKSEVRTAKRTRCSSSGSTNASPDRCGDPHSRRFTCGLVPRTFQIRQPPLLPPGWREPLKFRTLPGNRFARSLQTSLCGGARADSRGGRKTSQISEKPQELSHQSGVLLTSQWSHLSLKLDWRRTTFQVLHFRTRENNVERQKTPRHMCEC